MSCLVNSVQGKKNEKSEELFWQEKRRWMGKKISKAITTDRFLKGRRPQVVGQKTPQKRVSTMKCRRPGHQQAVFVGRINWDDFVWGKRHQTENTSRCDAADSCTVIQDLKRQAFRGFALQGAYVHIPLCSKSPKQRYVPPIEDAAPQQMP